MTYTSEGPNEHFPFILTTGRIRDQWHTMSKTGKVNKLNQHTSNAFIEMHPADGKRLSIREDDIVTVTSAKGRDKSKSKIKSGIKKGVVFVPMHWGKILGNDLNRVNNITSDLVDPISKEPDFKFCSSTGAEI